MFCPCSIICWFILSQSIQKQLSNAQATSLNREASFWSLDLCPCPLSVLSQGPRTLSPHKPTFGIESVFSKEYEVLLNIGVNNSYYLYNTSYASECYLFEFSQWSPSAGMFILPLYPLYFSLTFPLSPEHWLSMNHIIGLPCPLVSACVWLSEAPARSRRVRGEEDQGKFSPGFFPAGPRINSICISHGRPQLLLCSPFLQL